MYQEIVLEHFKNPRNVGTIQNPDGYAQAESHSCGDMIEVYVNVDHGRISELKYQTFGCAAAIASSSFASELVQGKPLEAVFAITDEQIARKLGLPETKFHCSVMVMRALHAAIENYYAKYPSEQPDQLPSPSD